MPIRDLDPDNDYHYDKTNQSTYDDGDQLDMSRSNPNEHLQNPTTRWFEWSGAKGEIRYWDKDAEQRVEVPLPFTFLLLDELATVRGWDKKGDCRIWANEVRDTSEEPLVVKSKLSGVLAEGLYRDFKKTLEGIGGHYAANLYLAYKDDEGNYALGALSFKGAALGAWLSFRNDKEKRPKLYSKAIRIDGFTEGKKGSITFRMPTFQLVDTSAQADIAAKALDAELQKYLTAYMQRNKRDQAAEPETHDVDDFAADAIDASEIPF